MVVKKMGKLKFMPIQQGLNTHKNACHILFLNICIFNILNFKEEKVE